MTDDVRTLFELMLAADRFCRRAKADSERSPQKTERKELREKISQCRGILTELQKAYDAEQLTVGNPLVRMQFRYLITSLFWVAFYMRTIIDRKLFRTLLTIESGFTYVLSQGTRRAAQ